MQEFCTCGQHVVFQAIFAKMEVEERYIGVVDSKVEYVTDLKVKNVDLHTSHIVARWYVVCFVGCRPH